MWEITNGWDMITAISAAIVALGILLAFGQLREARKTRRIEAFSQIVEAFGTVEQREARRFILTKLNSCELANLPDDERKKTEMVLSICDRISYLTLKGLVPEEDVLELLGRPMIRVWNFARTFVSERRRQAGAQASKDDPYRYLANFEKFVNKYQTNLRSN
jgi:hypothetical protein